jgi:D-alanyl-D-alanine dipeptidase
MPPSNTLLSSSRDLHLMECGTDVALNSGSGKAIEMGVIFDCGSSITAASY